MSEGSTMLEYAARDDALVAGTPRPQARIVTVQISTRIFAQGNFIDIREDGSATIACGSHRVSGILVNKQ